MELGDEVEVPLADVALHEAEAADSVEVVEEVCRAIADEVVQGVALEVAALEVDVEEDAGDSAEAAGEEASEVHECCSRFFRYDPLPMMLDQSKISVQLAGILSEIQPRQT